jgi:hypothetical protein
MSFTFNLCYVSQSCSFLSKIIQVIENYQEQTWQSPELRPTHHPRDNEDNTGRRNGKDSQPRTARVKEAVQGASTFWESTETTIPSAPLKTPEQTQKQT